MQGTYRQKQIAECYLWDPNAKIIYYREENNSVKEETEFIRMAVFPYFSVTYGLMSLTFCH